MMNIFDELLHRLGSKTRIRSLFKDMGMDEMERIINRLNEVLEEKNQEKEAADIKRKQKLQSVEEIKKVMEAKGLSMSDLNLLQEVGKEGKRKRNVSKHNFEFQTNSGDTVRWFGSTTGRLPKDFQDYLDRTGKKRIECVIESE
ncbi:H-NS family histone-like protein [Endozoicomonas sp. 2B-B]